MFSVAKKPQADSVALINETRKQRRVTSTFLPFCYLLALGPSLLPHLQVGFIADHRLLATQRWHLVLIEQKPQALKRE